MREGVEEEAAWQACEDRYRMKKESADERQGGRSRAGTRWNVHRMTLTAQATSEMGLRVKFPPQAGSWGSDRLDQT